jgi:hypothetical protein
MAFFFRAVAEKAKIPQGQTMSKDGFFLLYNKMELCGECRTGKTGK